MIYVMYSIVIKKHQNQEDDMLRLSKVTFYQNYV